MSLRTSLAVFLCTAAPAFAACAPGTETVLSCTANGGTKVLNVCLAGSTATYAYGPRHGAAELVLSAHVAQVEHQPWRGSAARSGKTRRSATAATPTRFTRPSTRSTRPTAVASRCTATADRSPRSTVTRTRRCWASGRSATPRRRMASAGTMPMVPGVAARGMPFAGIVPPKRRAPPEQRRRRRASACPSGRAGALLTPAPTSQGRCTWHHKGPRSGAGCAIPRAGARPAALHARHRLEPVVVSPEATAP